MAKYQRTYASKYEASKKFEVFKTNYKRIMQHNKSDAPYKLGINKFADFSDEELMAKHQGVIIPKRL